MAKGLVKVIGFDSWTGGARHFERLQDSFLNKGLDLSLIHLGSWGSDQGRPSRETIGTLDVRDISSYAQQSFLDILKSEDPSAVIFLSTDTFAHRAFIRYCRLRNLPTINLFHGLIGVQPVDTRAKNKVNVISQLGFVSTRILKALTHVWPAYAGALWKTGAAASEWVRFVRDIFDLSLGKYTLRAADDARTDVCCVFAPADNEFAAKKYGFVPERVVAVGNPDLIQFGLSPDLIGKQLTSGSQNWPNVMYADTGLVYTGTVFKSPGEFVQHLTDTNEALASQGKHLVFKPHPDHFRTDMMSALRKAEIDICLNEDYVSRLQQCCACIVEPSTVSVIPALMGLPLLLACYGKLKDQRYGRVLTTYPRSRALCDLADFSLSIEAAQTDCDAQATMRWIERNAGPLPAEEMPDRVADVVLKLIYRYSRERFSFSDESIDCHSFFQPGAIS